MVTTVTPEGLLPHVFTAAPEKFATLKARYAEPSRRYHDWTHIETLLGEFRRVRAQFESPNAALLAVYYHDAIYDVTSTANEAQSAELLLNEADGAETRKDLDLAAAFILATRRHAVDETLGAGAQRDCALFLDIDMSILGAPAASYTLYTRQIREEYAIFPDAAFNTGRLRVLEGFLGRPSIFLTDHFRDRLERAARINVESEIEGLKLSAGGDA